MLSWLHIGDLHLTEAGRENHRDLHRIVDLANALPHGSLDFVFLPGDNADDGTAAQFQLVQGAVDRLRLPLHVIPGDHDFKPRNLDAYYAVLGAQPLPFAVTLGSCRCLFLDVVSGGTGGPDFRIDAAQLAWLGQEIEAAAARRQDVAVFMHTYPSDLREGAEQLGTLLARPHVRCVDMGHTHYNELANDGSTVFMATRSTGQIEEGPAGISIGAVDGGVVSWRFKHLDQAWPLVLITQPADRRLVTGRLQDGGQAILIRAKIIGDAELVTVECQMDGSSWHAMAPVSGETAMWQASARLSGNPVRVRARDSRGRIDEDVVEPATEDWMPPRRVAQGSDQDRIGAWPAKGVFDTQLGPNRNGKRW